MPPAVVDYLLWYARDKTRIKYRRLYREKVPGEEGATQYTWVELPDGSRRPASGGEPPEPDAKVFAHGDMTSQTGGPTTIFPVCVGSSTVSPTKGGWKTNAAGMSRLIASHRLMLLGKSLRYVRYYADFAVAPRTNLWDDTITSGFGEEKRYVVWTHPRVIERCLLMTTDPSDLVLDPTCGSGTTAFVAEQWGRRWITIDTSRVALALSRTRLMAAKYPYYLLIDSEEGLRKEAEVTGQVPSPPEFLKPAGDVKRGFVYERVPHVTLKSIVNNDEIDLIHSKYEERLAPLLVRLNHRLRQAWQEWEVPAEADRSWPTDVHEIYTSWRSLRRERQREIDESIARRADTEFLFDKPYEDPKRIRVTGPFTVESLSPHRVLASDDERPASEAQAEQGEGASRFEPMILDNLRKAGVQNTRRDERLVFDRLEPFAGAWVQAAGEYTDAAGKVRRVAVSIGPENGTVGPHQIQEAAKEAVRGIPFDLLLVLGFAFDAHASDVAREISPAGLRIEEGFVAEREEQYGKLPVLLVRMNPDLAMGDELLKKTGAGNLFMVFGEPDLAIAKQPDGKLVVEIRGLDVYDPTTGVIRNSTTDDIACWFIDTDYNGESFFVRHAYFTGADEPYDRLKRALRADIDEAAWATLYTTKSRPFDPPTTGKIAVKVINHYGDEVLKVYAL